MDSKLPQAVEAIAAYPSERAWRSETSPLAEQPKDLNASDALLMLAYPLLVPDVVGEDPLVVLEDAADLARDPGFRDQRDAFYNWLRGYLSPLQRPDLPLRERQTDEDSLKVARYRLKGQLDKQAELLKKKNVWRIGTACNGCLSARPRRRPLWPR